MTEELILELLVMTLQTMGLLMAPTLIGVVVIGVIVNVLQTITQIKDPALAFIPKVIAMAVILLATAAWSLQILNTFCTDMILLAGRGAF